MDENMKCSDAPKGKEATFFEKLNEKHCDCHGIAGELSMLCVVLQDKVQNQEPAVCSKESCDKAIMCPTEDALDNVRALRNRLRELRQTLTEINEKL